MIQSKVVKNVLSIFLIWRGAFFFLHLVTLSFIQVPKETKVRNFIDNNDFLNSFLRWDTGWYIKIIENGYNYNPEKASNVAFFPLYPLSVKFLHFVTSLDIHLSGLLVSNFCLLMALFFVYKISNFYLNHKLTQRGLILMLVFPCSFFYSSFYTESLYLLTISASFYYFITKQYHWSGIWGFLASLTKLTGVLLFVSFGIELIINHTRKTEFLKLKMLYLFLIPSGLLLYMVFLTLKFNEPFAYLKTQKFWRKYPFVFPLVTVGRAFKNIDFSFPKDSGNSLQFIEFTLIILFLLVAAYLLFKPSFNLSLSLFSILSMMVPLVSGTTMSMMRFLLPIFPIFISLGYLSKNQYLYSFLIFSFSYLLSVLFL